MMSSNVGFLSPFSCFSFLLHTPIVCPHSPLVTLRLTAYYSEYYSLLLIHTRNIMVSFRKAALLLLAVDQAAGFSSPRALLSLYVSASHVVSSSSLRMSTAANGSVNGIAAAAAIVSSQILSRGVS